MPWLPLKYREYYDLPRAFVVEYRHALYFFDSRFDAETDEYSDYFDVYRLPMELANTLDQMSWEHLDLMGEVVGRVPTTAVHLDPSKRQFVDDGVFALLRRSESN